jgi:cytochrome P450
MARNPYPLYAEMRVTGDLVPLGPGLWATARWSICDALLRDRRLDRQFLAAIERRYGLERAAAPVFQTFARMLLMMTPPQHTRLRGLLMKAFNAKQVAELERTVQVTAQGLVEKLVAKDHGDLMAEFARPLPILVICRLLDIPLDDTERLAPDVDRVVYALEIAPMTPEQLEAANAALERLVEYFRPILHERRRHLGTDLISLLLSTEEQGERLSEPELLANIILLFLAGHETTTNMIGNALIALQQHPDVLARVRANRTLVPAAALECVRFDGSVQVTGRTALQDVEIAGQVLPRGTMVFAFVGGANRDPDRFPDPDVLRLDRGDHAGKPLTFGGGVHYCLGARLATIEMDTALATLIEHLPRLRLTNLDSLQWHARNTLRGVRSLQAEW